MNNTIYYIPSNILNIQYHKLYKFATPSGVRIIKEMPGSVASGTLCSFCVFNFM
jgi:hypothetical protein